MRWEDEKTPVVIHAIPEMASRPPPPMRQGSGIRDTWTTPTPGASPSTLSPLGRASESGTTQSRPPAPGPRGEAGKRSNGPPPLPHPADMRFLRLVQGLSPENRFLLESIALALLGRE